MRNFNVWPFYGWIHRSSMWVRVVSFHYGLHIKNSPPLFSERYGYEKWYPLFGKWRFRFLKASK